MREPRDYSDFAGPIGPYRDKRVVAIGDDDFVLDTGFTCQAATAGDLTYRTLIGEADQEETNLAVGDTITGPSDIPVVLKAVRGSSSVTSIVIGIL